MSEKPTAKRRPNLKFIDLHLHGAFGCDFSQPDSRGQVFQTLEKLYESGVTAFCPTLISSDQYVFSAALKFWGNFLREFRVGYPNASKSASAKRLSVPLGLHLEGPFLSPKKAGAHPQVFLEAPSLSLLKKFKRESLDSLRILTLAPELKNALQVIAWAAKSNIRVQLGHSCATTSQALAGLRSGATGFTHLFNAMDFHHRNAGLVGAFLFAATRANKIGAEIICDGLHVDPFLAFGLLQKYSPILYPVSDACSLAGHGSHEATLGSLKVHRNVSNQNLAFADRQGKLLAGSAVLLPEHPKLLAAAIDCSVKEVERFFKLSKSLLPSA